MSAQLYNNTAGTLGVTFKGRGALPSAQSNATYPTVIVSTYFSMIFFACKCSFKGFSHRIVKILKK